MLTLEGPADGPLTMEPKIMFTTRVVAAIGGALAVGLLAGSAGTFLASAASPEPTAGTYACNGATGSMMATYAGSMTEMMADHAADMREYMTEHGGMTVGPMASAMPHGSVMPHGTAAPGTSAFPNHSGMMGGSGGSGMGGGSGMMAP